MAGPPDGEAPHRRGTGVAQSAESLNGAIGEVGIDVGEPAAVADGDVIDLGPSFLGSLIEPLGEGGLGRFGNGDHGSSIFAAAVCHRNCQADTAGA